MSNSESQSGFEGRYLLWRLTTKSGRRRLRTGSYSRSFTAETGAPGPWLSLLENRLGVSQRSVAASERSIVALVISSKVGVRGGALMLVFKMENMNEKHF